MIPASVIHIRLPQQAYSRLTKLHRTHFAGLPLSAITRLLVIDQLKKDEKALTEIILARLKAPLHGAD